MSDEGHVSIEYNISDHNGYNVQNDSNFKSFDFNSESPKIYINNENNTFGKLNQYSGDSYNFNDRILLHNSYLRNIIIIYYVKK